MFLFIIFLLLLCIYPPVAIIMLIVGIAYLVFAKSKK